ncbi:MAG: acyltransferase domain-containing protein [Clostridiales bacterium]|nr:acyltransferase domain-containing protein [Clostridiales bacterium]MDY4009210.1 acyltransferase domain-containing protein [Candidatus Limiplasma sp.]
MLISQKELNEAFALISFSSRQRQAIETVWRQLNQNPLLERLARKDAAGLADPHGPEKIEADAAQLTALLGGLADVYPALILLTRVSWLKGEYALHGIHEAVLRDALSDIPLWMTHFENRAGRVGLGEYTWLTNHMRMRLFRLGRLEYIFTKSRVRAWFYRNDALSQCVALADSGLRFEVSGQLCTETCGQVATHHCENGVITGYPVDSLGRIQPQPVSLPANQWRMALAPGDPVLDVHIPEGPPMTPDAITASLQAAIPFYRDHLGLREERAFTCSSWLMSPALPQLLPGSNLAAFQKRFRVVPYTLRDNQVFERVYGKGFTAWQEMPMETRLQRGVRDWYMAGGVIRQMQGVILRKEMEEANHD